MREVEVDDELLSERARKDKKNQNQNLSAGPQGPLICLVSRRIWWSVAPSRMDGCDDWTRSGDSGYSGLGLALVRQCQYTQSTPYESSTWADEALLVTHSQSHALQSIAACDEEDGPV